MYQMTQGVPGNAPNLDTFVGISINGVAILSSSSLNRVDPFYPRNWPGALSVTAEMVDACLAHPQVAGIYHYHILPPCIVNAANIQTNATCAGIAACASDLRSYALSSYDNFKQEIILGVAKDGHMILGPYADSGN
jgi:hypothetical protein